MTLVCVFAPIAIEKYIVKSNNLINLYLVRPSWKPSITDCFLDIIELVRYSLEDLGYQVTESVNEYLPGRNIIFGAHLMPPEECQAAPDDSIVYQMEQLPMFINGALIELMRRCTVWEYSEANFNWLENTNIQNVKYVPFGYHEKMERIIHDYEPVYDFLFYGSENKRRKEVIASWWEANRRVKFVNHGAIGLERDDYIKQSRIIVSMHQFQDKVSPIHEMARVYYLMTNRCCVLSEVGENTHIYPWVKDAIVTAPYEKLVEIGLKLAKDPVWQDDVRLKSYLAIREHQMANIIYAALN